MALIQVFSDYFGFLLSVSFHQRSILNSFIDTLIMSDNLPKRNAGKEIGEHWVEKNFQLS